MLGYSVDGETIFLELFFEVEVFSLAFFVVKLTWNNIVPKNNPKLAVNSISVRPFSGVIRLTIAKYFMI
jgi:hypothetical protein